MANNCEYDLRAVSKSKETLEQFIAVMKYEHPDYYLYRVFEADPDSIVSYQDLFGVYISGDVGWSCYEWVHSSEDLNKKSGNGAHYISMRELCKRLDVGVEIFSREPGCAFQEHYVIDHTGTVLVDETEQWIVHWTDETGNLLDTPVETGGFSYYGDFLTCSEIFNEEEENKNESK